jgi:probable sporulation protein (polysaccharide deacetylase family)
MYKVLLHWTVFLAILLFVFSSIQNPFSSAYIHDLKPESISVVSNPDSSLYEQLQLQAAAYEKKPINAVIDPVWKAVPGYNGINVDIKASHQKMKKEDRFDPSKLVYNQVPPEVSLEDLPAAPIYKGNPEKQMVAFLINVAWGNEYIPTILEILDEEKVQSTFFLDGSWVRKNPELAKMILEKGHEIGNHAYSHPDLKTLTFARIEEELTKTNEVIQATLDVTPTVFAPPSGSFREEVVTIANNMNMKTILWSVDTIDWRKPEPVSMAERVVSKVHPGATILMHPTSSTAAGIKQMVTGIKNKGYRIGTVSQLIDEKRIIPINVDNSKGTNE